MSYMYDRRYVGPVEAIITDWAGTTVDFGCMAPVMAFQRAFAGAGVAVSAAEARGPMGKDKRTHVEEVLFHPAVAQRWEQAKGAAPTQSDVDAIYEAYIPLQIEAIRERAQLIPGWLDAYEELREHGLRFGANTGYNREMSEVVVAAAAEAGFRPDSVVNADEVPQGRPFPAMALLNAAQLGVTDVAACIKVDDTVPGIEEGLAAGMWTVGVAVSGNAVGLDVGEWEAKTDAEQEILRDAAVAKLSAAGAHVVVDSVADLPGAVEMIEEALMGGGRP